MRFRCNWLLIIACLTLTATVQADGRQPIKLLQTADGIEFGILGEKPAAPAATLFVFAADLKQTLTDPAFNKVGQLLAKQGVLCVALDAPCHGKDNKENAVDGLIGWRQRLDAGADFLSPFKKRCSAVLDYLVAEKYTDPKHVVVAGTSRGGFLALHFAASEPRVRGVVAFAPVTELSALTEFKGMKTNAAVEAASLANTIDKFANRGVWIWIGSDDQRVGTDHAVAFAKKLSKTANVELHVKPAKGHTVDPKAHEEAATWLAKILNATG